MFSSPKPNKVEDWECIYETNTEYDAQLAKNYLENREIEASILSKRDSAFDVNVGDLALIYVYVPKALAKKAKKAISEWQDTQSDENEEE